MTLKNNPHSFHIPVMGLAFTLDSPIKIARYGISSVISIVDDFIIEKLNAYYAGKFDLPFETISTRVHDYRAKRITSYLNNVDILVKRSFDNLVSSIGIKGGDFEKYMELLPDFSDIKHKFNKTFDAGSLKEDIKNWVSQNLPTGSIDVNIMTKLDKANYAQNRPLSSEFNDAHAALRGFAHSSLESALILSAGMNPRLYSYIENFDDFFPDENDFIKKRIILKVSDYRSALIQGKFLAKKGLWVSEYRIESGLNCGGHAFASDGFLLGPILEEFKNNKGTLLNDTYALLSGALKNKNKHIPSTPLEIKITVQGGVGTVEEHEFLLNNYEVDSVGWGSPFLLVPEATTVDTNTLKKLADSGEEDLYLSNSSPLGVPFNSLKDSSNEMYRNSRITVNKSGSSCPKKFLVSNTEYSERAICTASRKYQSNKLASLKNDVESGLVSLTDLQQITEKTCLCEGLANAAISKYDLKTKGVNMGVAVCPGPNLAYFKKEMSLREIVGHIYGKNNVIENVERPHMFIKELKLYLNFFNEKVNAYKTSMTVKQTKYLHNFQRNLNDGIRYYENLFTNMNQSMTSAIKELRSIELQLSNIVLQKLQPAII